MIPHKKQRDNNKYPLVFTETRFWFPRMDCWEEMRASHMGYWWAWRTLNHLTIVRNLDLIKTVLGSETFGIYLDRQCECRGDTGCMVLLPPINQDGYYYRPSGPDLSGYAMEKLDHPGDVELHLPYRPIERGFEV